MAQTTQSTLKVVDTPAQPTRAPSFEIMSNNNAVRYLKALFYGDYGSGKTYLCGTSVAVSEMRDVLLLSAEAGDLTLYDPESEYDFSLIDLVNVPDFKIAGRVHDFLKLHCSFRDKASAGDEQAQDTLLKLQQRMMPNVVDPNRLRLYRTCIIDSLYEIESYIMYQLLGVTSDTIIDEEINKGTWDEIGQQRLMIHRLIRGFRNLPMNILFTCPRMYRKPSNESREVYLPSMTGKLASEVQGFVDIVGMLIVGEPKQEAGGAGGAEESDEIPDVTLPRRLFIQPGPRHRAKSRFTRYKKPYFDNPTIPEIVKAVGLLDTWQLANKTRTPNPDSGKPE